MAVWSKLSDRPLTEENENLLSKYFNVCNTRVEVLSLLEEIIRYWVALHNEIIKCLKHS